MTDLSPSITVITLNINGLHTVIKRQRLTQWAKKQKQKKGPVIYCLKETISQHRGRLKVSRWERRYQKKKENCSGYFNIR